jgi:hypothetical protein
MSSRRRRIAIALVCGATSMVALPLLLPGDWTPYAIELALLGVAVSLLVFRAQGSTWARGTVDEVVPRALRLVIVSLFVLIAGCTAVFVGASAITGCPIMGDPTGTLTLVKAHRPALRASGSYRASGRSSVMAPPVGPTSRWPRRTTAHGCTAGRSHGARFAVRTCRFQEGSCGVHLTRHRRSEALLRSEWQ